MSGFNGSSRKGSRVMAKEALVPAKGGTGDRSSSEPENNELTSSI
jgi:hypothetical protein